MQRRPIFPTSIGTHRRRCTPSSLVAFKLAIRLLPKAPDILIFAHPSMATPDLSKRLRMRMHRVPGWKETATVLAIFVVAVLASPRAFDGSIIFLDPANLTDALRALVPVAITSLAMTFVILTGGIDLSVGAMLALSGVVTARVLMEWQTGPAPAQHIAVALMAGILAAAMVGFLNGVLISWLRIQAFIVTLASMIGVRGLALWTANNERIGLGVGQDVPGHFGEWFSRKGVMVGTWLVLAVVFFLILNRTVFGRHLRALGDNSSAARLAGLPIARIQIAVYTLSGLLAGVAGVLLAARTTTGDPNAGVALELDAIAVVVIGGASLAGGRGGIYGTLSGALIIGMVTNILGLRNVGSNAQLVLKAAIIVLSVAAQRTRGRP